MADIDLIPESYRRHRWLCRRLRAFGFTYVAVAVGVVAVNFVLSSSVAREAAAIERLEAQRRAVVERRQRLQALQLQRTALREQLDVLEKLRGGPQVREVFVSIDRAIDDRVWFSDWKFMRAGEFVEVDPNAVHTGYLIIIPENRQDGKSKAWRLHTHMEITARATDHSTLAGFVDRLARQSVIGEVKVLSTRSVREANGSAIEFELAVVVDDEGSRG